MKRLSYLISILLLNIVLYASSNKGEETENHSVAAFTNTPIQFYGKIVDQYQNPIEGVCVDVGISKVIELQIITEQLVLTTDENGCFEVKSQGYKVFIGKLEKDGFDFLYSENNNRSFTYKTFRQNAQFIPEKDNPIIFEMHRKSYPDYLIYDSQDRDIWFYVDEPKNVEIGLFDTMYFDPFGNYGILPEGIQFGPNVNPFRYKHILFQGMVLPDHSLEIKILPLVQNSSCYMADEFLYEAPEDGYQEYAIINFGGNSSGKCDRWIYFKLNSGQMYALLEIHAESIENGVHLSVKRAVNLSGSKGFEYDQKFNFDETQWREEVHHLRKREKLVSSQEKWNGMTVQERQTFSAQNEKFNESIRLMKKMKDNENPRWWHNLEKGNKK